MALLQLVSLMLMDLIPQGHRKGTFAVLQTRLVHTRATRVAPTPDVGVPITADARIADLSVQLCVAGPELV